MQSRRRIAPLVGRDGLRGSPAVSQQELPAVEVDATFARLIGLQEGHKVGILLHLDPPQAHTINIEPLTPVDWEMIELHAQFLELNFLSQIRALPNPQAQSPHPVALHLSPTTTANITVTSIAPAPPATSLFVKISPDAEVIVAPKTRQEERSSARESRSVGGASRKSGKSGKSTASTVRRRSGREDATSKGVVFLRGVDRTVAQEWFEEEEDADAEGLKVWVDKDVLLAKALRGANWVSVAVIKPAGLQEPVDMSQQQEQEKPATRIVAKIAVWEDAPDSRHVALSSDLCQVLGFEGFVGGLVRIEGAPAQTPKPSAIKPQGARETRDPVVKTVKIVPFTSTASQGNASLKFGGESKQDQEAAIQKIKTTYGKKNGLLDGPVTDGMILPPAQNSELGWQGGIVRFEPPQSTSGVSWVLFPERKPPLELGQEVSTPTSWAKGWQQGEPLPETPANLVGIDPLIEQLRSHLTHHSSVLLTGGLGAGKSNCAQLLAHQLRTEYLFNTIYFPCRKLVTDETRVATIKETLNRLFASASWGARGGGNAVVILDDLDKLCPAETELQVGNENGRSRHVSECLINIVRQYCSMDSGVVLLATAQGKEALNNVIVGGHIVREIVSLKAPNKDGRRKVLEMLAFKDAKSQEPNGHAFPCSPDNSRPSTSHRSQPSIDSIPEQPKEQYGFTIDRSIDFLDLAGQTDGYMPGDLVLLTSRARNEALIRSVTSTSSTVMLTREDYTQALSGFTPASLRNVTLQSSTTKWDSIGGLHTTRQVLLETLQYPTTYAPIFAKCPLRLRSGLLLYGYPGCGKTLLASAVAGECGLNFISVKGPEILNKYIGASEKSVRDLFERAEAARPCVLFFDEFDSIAPKRGHDSTGVTDRVVNQLLTQMDGAEGLSGVYVLAATSRPDLIDPALLRPGRLDKSLCCDMPDVEERIDILRAVTRKLNLSPSILDASPSGENLREIAQRTAGYSGADLQAVVYNAQLEAIHDALGDADPTKIGSGKKDETTGRKEGEKGIPDFSYFRYGEDPSSMPAATAVSTSAQLTERAVIAQKIAALQALRRKQKAFQRPGSRGKDGEDEAKEEEDGERKDPQIQWKHIESSLTTGRSSISAQERMRLERIYREFVEGRDGDLPNGQGGTEIGGRSSLM
jgi:peroxin-1